MNIDLSILVPDRSFFVTVQQWVFSMDNKDVFKQRASEVIREFFQENMSINPKAVEVDLHSDCLVVTLRDAIPAGEKAYACEKSSSDLLSEFYKDIFEYSKKTLELLLENATGIEVHNSCISLHPQIGSMVVLLNISQG